MPIDSGFAEERREQIGGHLLKAGRALDARQIEARGPMQGNVSPWETREEEDFHGTLLSVWVWARHQARTGQKRFEESRALAWRFILESSVRYVPESLTESSYEGPFDCATVLLAAIADKEAGSEEPRQALAVLAGDALRGYIETLGPSTDREFRDPGFLVYCLASYAQAMKDDRAAKVASGYAERFFGSEAPRPPLEESAPKGALFDFFSAGAMRCLAGIATQPESAFLGLWLRQRILPVLPRRFVKRPLDEHPFNASIAWLLGSIFTLTHEGEALTAYDALLGELQVRDKNGDCALGRDATFPEFETIPTFTWAAAVDALRI